jgi:hypothetical protein
MATPTPNAVTAASNWNFQNSYVERLMDHSALTAAHPDDTLILAGPARYLTSSSHIATESMLPLGMVQNMQITSQNPVIPAQAVGSGRYFYLVGKPNHGANIARLFVKGRNLLRALYTNAILAGVDPSKFDDRAMWASQDEMFVANMDSELFKIPFGLAVYFRDKIHDSLGALYMEACLLTNWSLGVTAGQSMIMENVNVISDRIIPINASAFGSARQGYPSQSSIFKAVFQGDANAVDVPPFTG